MVYICNHFPVITVDSFFDHPDSVVREAENLEYGPDPHGLWPGVRSQHLKEAHPEIYYHTMRKFLSLWYSSEEMSRINWDCDMWFQRISPPVKERKDSPLNTGWVHRDFPTISAGVVYLTPGANSTTGTGIYTDEENLAHPLNRWSVDNGFQGSKEQVYSKSFSPADLGHLENKKKQHDSHFKPDIIVSNRYNRLISYGSQYAHKEQYLGSKIDNKDRLTLVFFLRDISGVDTPLLKKLRGV